MHTDTLNLIGRIYDTVSAPERWSEFLDNLARSLNSHATRMRMLDNRGSGESNCLIAGSGHDTDFDKQYANHFVKVDPWNPILATVPLGIVADSSEMYDPREFSNTEMYNDFWRHYEVFHGLGLNLIKTDNFIARIGVHRSSSQGAYSEQEKQLLQELAPHLLRAFKLGSHLEAVQSQLDGAQQALYHSASPLLLIDEFGQVAFTNQRTESLLGSESGISIRNAQFTLTNEGEQAAFRQLLQLAVATGAGKGTGSGGAMRLTTPIGDKRYNLLVTPYPDRSVSYLGLNRRICAAVFIRDTQQAGQLQADALKALYGLTRSEIRLAEGVIEGLSPAEAATRYGVSVNTIRSQLRSLFAKTDTQRQAELVRLLSGLTGIS
jgi:DNA-binding CsgD family transcriptional regulator